MVNETIKFIRCEPHYVEDEIIDNVVCLAVALNFCGADTVIGYIYKAPNGKLFRRWCSWL